MGTLLLPPSPSTFRRMQRQRNVALDAHGFPSGETVAGENIERHQPDKAAIELFSYATAWWSLLGIVAVSLPLVTTTSGSIVVQHKRTISRRLVRISNLTFAFATANSSVTLSRRICPMCCGWRLTIQAFFGGTSSSTPSFSMFLGPKSFLTPENLR